MIEKDAVLHIPWNCTVKEKGNQRLFIDKDTGKWFRANLTGTHILQTLDGGRSVADVLRIVADEYGLPVEMVEAEAMRFLDDAVQHGVCRRIDTSGAASCEEPSTDVRTWHLRELWIHPHARCNLNCVYCYNYDGPSSVKDGSLETSDLEPWVEHIRAHQNGSADLSVVISGGEPMLWFSRTLEIARYMKESGVCRSISLLSNGTVGTADEWRQLLPVLDMVQFSMDGSRPEINDRVRSEGSFEKTVRSIKLIQQSKPDIGLDLRFVVTRDNWSDMGAFAKLACDLEVRAARFCKLTRHGRGIRADELMASEEETMQGVQEAFESYNVLKSTRPNVHTIVMFDEMESGVNLLVYAGPRTGCGAGKRHLLIAENGHVYPCVSLQSEEFTFGDIRQDTPGDILNRAQQWNSDICVDKTVFCRNCDYRKFCGGSCRAGNWRSSHDVHGVDSDTINETTGRCIWREKIEAHMWQLPSYDSRRYLQAKETASATNVKDWQGVGLP